MSNTGHRQNIIVVLGREWGRLDTEPDQCLKEQINNTLIISTPDVLKLKGKHMLDLMALTFPGPHLFLVRLEEGRQPEGELRKWEEVFGEDISHNMIYITDERCIDSRFSGKCLSICDIIKQCKHIISNDICITYHFEEVLKRRRNQLEKAAKTDTHQYSRDPAQGGQRKSPQLNLVLLGESGSGKSASGNTILGMKAFTSEPSSKPVTTECERQTKSICGTEVTVIDTPYFFDDFLQVKSTDILRCKQLCRGGLCVYLLVIQIGRFTEGERDILERLEKALQPRVRDRAIILFTRGDDLTSHIDEYVKGTNPHLRQLVDKCGGRYQKFNNTNLFSQQPNEKGGQVISNTTSCGKTEEEKQVKELMGEIVKLVKTTDNVKVFPESDEKNGCVLM